jgi:hypothetical protein
MQGNSSGGRGGGTIRLNITKNMKINGLISCNGEDGLDGQAGGSGGSILIYTANMQVWLVYAIG